MGRASVLLLLIVAACAGAQIPQHNGYKTGAKAKPWKKAKTLKFDDKNEAKAQGELSYADFKRAAWYTVDLQSPGQLDIKLDITPPGEEVDDEFDLGFEVLDPGNRVIARSNKEEGEDIGEVQKSKSLLDLEPGRYMVHLYLQDRRDSCDFVMRASFKPMNTVGKSDFPSQVAFTPALPMVPLQDDTPKGYKSPTTTTTVVVKHPPKGPREPKPPKETTPPPVTTKSARIIGMQVIGGGTQITIGLGTAGGASVGMKGKINNVSSGGFTIAACNERTCTATVSATPDQIKGSGAVTLGP